jgi:SAM-dependent methyltransferase
MVHHEACPVCASGKIVSFISCADHFLSKENFELYKCTDCSFVFTQDHPAEEDIGRYYESDDYISHSTSSKGLLNKIYFLVRSIMLRKKRNIVKNMSGLKRGTLLDIGSGAGHFAEAMKDAGWLVKGVEINEKARDFSIKRAGLEVISPDSISSLMSGSFDCITLWHVLEHFHSPYKYPEEIMRLLRPGGLCLVALPNSASYDAEHYKQYWAAYDVPRHLWHFNPESFSLFSEKSGFINEKFRILLPDVFYISILSEKYRGGKLSFLTGMIRGLLFAFMTLFNRRKSSSVIYILRKPLPS